MQSFAQIRARFTARQHDIIDLRPAPEGLRVIGVSFDTEGSTREVPVMALGIQRNHRVVVLVPSDSDMDRDEFPGLHHGQASLIPAGLVFDNYRLVWL